MDNPPAPNSTTSALASYLAAYGAKPKLEGAWYNGQKFQIDGYHFVGCRFDRCTLHLSSTEFEFERCLISDDTVLVFSPAMMRPIKMFFSRLTTLDDAFPKFVPIRHTDGTISIS